MKMMKQFPARTGLALLLIFFGFSVWLIFQYVATERQRDLAHWQSRLGMLADLHRSAVESELNTRREQLRELAGNPSLQLYLSQYASASGQDDVVLSAQFAHVRNLLAASAERFGFAARQDSSVNIDATEEYGLAITDQQGKLLLGSKGFLPDSQFIRNQVQQALGEKNIRMIDLFSPDSGDPAYGFVMPVQPIQGIQSTPVGAVIMLLDPHTSLFRHLANNHLDTRSDETLLLRRDDNQLVFISPLQADFSLFHRIDASSTLAEALSWSSAGFVQAQDYLGHDVLATARSVANTGWQIVHKLDTDEALAESNRHQQFLLSSFLLIAGLIGVSFIAIWRHSTSVRLQELAASLEAQTTLLNAVNDNINEIIFLVDENNNLVFINSLLAKILGIQPGDATGKNLGSVLGTDIAFRLENLHCHMDRGSQECMVSLPLGHGECTYHVSSILLSQGRYQNKTLYVLHDITELRVAQEKRDRLAQGIINTLVKAVDLHDPYCVDHSSRTREVAMCIAEELKLEPARCHALEMAALLANIGKLFLPREILTKMEPLNEAENEMLKWHINYAVDILKQLEFEGPVVEIIAQKNEYLDGSGYPHGLGADNLLPESRILAVANAFVAMASARAYREGRPIKEVLDILLKQCDQRYDRHVVAALFHIAENKADWHSWQAVRPTQDRR